MHKMILNGGSGKRVDAKIVIIGNADVGKTALMERFVYMKFSDNNVQTIGATFVSKEVQRGKDTLVFAIWDTAGTERYRSMTKQFYRNAKAAIICYDLTNQVSWEVLRSWVTELRCNERGCRLYICGTKKDLLDDGYCDRDIPEDKAQFYAQGLQIPLIDTSSKTGENVDKLFSMIADDLWDDRNRATVTDVNTSVSLVKSQRRRWCFIL